MTQASLSRRDFVKRSAALGVLGATVPYAFCSSSVSADSAGSRHRIGCIGLGWRGMDNAEEHAQFGDIVAISDVDARHAEKAKHDKGIGKGKADLYGEYRKLLERKDIDVVSITTPDHWHVKMAIEALEAGKHVFCEKPLTLTLEENRLIRDACKKHTGKVFQVGTQQRSFDKLFLRAVNMVQKGLLGQIQKIVIGINGSPKGGPFAKAELPKELNWDTWLGQAAKVEYIPQRCHQTFRWWYEYSGGKFTDWGAHHIDIAQWAIGCDKEGLGPIEIDGSDAKHPVPFADGYPTVDNCYNSATDFAIKMKYPGGIDVIVDSRSRNGIHFEGTAGRIFVDRERITGKPIEENWDKDKFGPDDLVRLYKGKPFEDHKANFYRAIREGGLPVSDVLSHVQTMNTCHLCSIAARLTRTIRWDAKAERIVGDDQAAAFTSRAQREGYAIPKV